MSHWEEFRERDEERRREQHEVFRKQQLSQGKVEVPLMVARLHDNWRTGQFVPKESYDRFLKKIRDTFGLT